MGKLKNSNQIDLEPEELSTTFETNRNKIRITTTKVGFEAVKHSGSMVTFIVQQNMADNQKCQNIEHRT